MRNALLVFLLIAAGLQPASGNDKPVAAAKPSSPNAGKKVHLEGIAAIINDSIILRSELEARLVPLRAEAEQIADLDERKRRMTKLAGQALDEMVNEELIVQAARTAKIEVEGTEVQAAVDEIKQQNKLDDAGLEQALAAQGYTLANYKADLRRQVLRFRAVNQLIGPKVQVTDDDVRARYDQLQRRSEAVSAVRVSHILIKLPDRPTESQQNDAKAKAVKAIERVKAGEDFAKVAADMSDDDGTKTTGGELGWIERGSLSNPDWEQTLFSMDKAEVRGPISGPQGLEVFTVTDTKKSELKPFAEMKEQIQRDLRRRELDKQTQTWVEDLRKKAYIDVKI